MGLHPSVVERLGRLAPDQRVAATAPPGPMLCIAPAGSGKTTTLVARIAWLIASGGARADGIAAITFNKRAAVEMTERLDAAVAPLGVAAGAVRVRTFHAMGREILRDAGVAVERMADRAAILAEVAPWADEAALLRLDTVISRLKVDLGVSADVAADPVAGPMARAFVAYEAALAAAGALDFDDLILRAIVELERDEALLARWRLRCGELLVDEVQDVDRAQLRLALLLAAPANRIFLVGDDDQSIYGWRLADVRRILGLAGQLPGLRRVDLEVNYRCPDRWSSGRCDWWSTTASGSPRRSGPGRPPPAGSSSPRTRRMRRSGWNGRSARGRRTVRRARSWPGPTASCCPPSWSRSGSGCPFRAPRIDLLLDSPVVDRLLGRAAELDAGGVPLLVLLGRVRDETAADREASEVATALLGWAVGTPAWPTLRPRSRTCAGASPSCAATTRRSPWRRRTRPRASSSTMSSSSAWKRAASRARVP